MKAWAFCCEISGFSYEKDFLIFYEVS